MYKKLFNHPKIEKKKENDAIFVWGLSENIWDCQKLFKKLSAASMSMGSKPGTWPVGASLVPVVPGLRLLSIRQRGSHATADETSGKALTHQHLRTGLS